MASLLLGLLLLNLLLHLLFLGRGHLRERGAGRARDRHMRRRLLRLRRRLRRGGILLLPREEGHSASPVAEKERYGWREMEILKSK